MLFGSDQTMCDRVASYLASGCVLRVMLIAILGRIYEIIWRWLARVLLFLYFWFPR